MKELDLSEQRDKTLENGLGLKIHTYYYHKTKMIPLIWLLSKLRLSNIASEPRDEGMAPELSISKQLIKNKYKMMWMLDLVHIFQCLTSAAI